MLATVFVGKLPVLHVATSQIWRPLSPSTVTEQKRVKARGSQFKSGARSWWRLQCIHRLKTNPRISSIECFEISFPFYANLRHDESINFSIFQTLSDKVRKTMGECRLHRSEYLQSIFHLCKTHWCTFLPSLVTGIQCLRLTSNSNTNIIILISAFDKSGIQVCQTSIIQSPPPRTYRIWSRFHFSSPGQTPAWIYNSAGCQRLVINIIAINRAKVDLAKCILEQA